MLGEKNNEKVHHWNNCKTVHINMSLENHNTVIYIYIYMKQFTFKWLVAAQNELHDIFGAMIVKSVPLYESSSITSDGKCQCLLI